MKTFIYTLIILLFSANSFAQEVTKDRYTVKETHIFVERVSKKNIILEKGSYLKNGKLDGKWVAYHTDGTIKSIAEYQNGEKVGNWLHHDQFTGKTFQVSYDQNMVASIVETDKTSLVIED
ncbi:MAG: hypothetical protein N4A45_09925 [Flavobacteriales bacterium]|jgi:antitoxin component YwqK of YwqJK toxin-antitoxin module|nr:hypothetical protein [Flavobacteriales bacterium]